MVDVRRHAPVARHRAPRLREQQGHGLANVARGRARHIARDIYDTDEASTRSARPFRWMLSTLLAAVVGITVSLIVIYGSLRGGGTSGDLMTDLENATKTVDVRRPRSQPDDGLPWLTPKEDRLQLATTALTIRQVIHEQVRVRRDGKPFLQIKPYLRLTVRLAPASPEYADLIPSFNPLQLFANPAAVVANSGSGKGPGNGTIDTRIVDLLDGRLPAVDGQTFEEFEIATLVKQAIETAPEQPSVRFGLGDGESDDATLTGVGLTGNLNATGEQTGLTVLRRAPSAADGTPISLEDRQVRVVTARPGENLAQALGRIGAPRWQTREITYAAVRLLQSPILQGGEQLHVTTVPSLENPNASDVLKLSVFASAHTHKISVKRTASGQFLASRSPDQGALIRAMTTDNAARLSTLYAAVYGNGLAQKLTPEQIMTIVRVHAHDVDFQRKVQPGDALELFCEATRDPKTGELKPTSIVYTALTTGGEARRFWRFRSQDGSVDYFDAGGLNARKFLLRKPVRGNNVRFTSGFGPRRHPILNRVRRHNGIDWAAPTGTPIMAAGRGNVEFVGRRGAYGNFIRIRHANGYDTSYAHMVRFARGMRNGVKVRQGQVIGYIGTTGLSSGPHLHYEVRVNERHVDPLKIKVGRERSLEGREMAEFQRERERITTVMRSPPVRVAKK